MSDARDLLRSTAVRTATGPGGPAALTPWLGSAFPFHASHELEVTHRYLTFTVKNWRARFLFFARYVAWQGAGLIICVSQISDS
jgi:hypothetical protein